MPLENKKSSSIMVSYCAARAARGSTAVVGHGSESLRTADARWCAAQSAAASASPAAAEKFVTRSTLGTGPKEMQSRFSFKIQNSPD